ADTALSLRAEGEDGTSFGTESGRLVYESVTAQLVTLLVGATPPTTYLLRIDLAPPAPGIGGTTSTAVEGDFDADDWIGMEWSGDPPGGLQDYQGSTSCPELPADSACHDYYGTVITRPGLFTESGADNRVEAMAWLLHNTGTLVDDQAVWKIVDAVVFEAPIGDRVLNTCTLFEGARPVVAYADLVGGTVTGALAWDWEAEKMSLIPADRVRCFDGAGDVIAVGPGFG
ncbi:MAG: hypothetical protein KJ956_09165, partial [Actinobacteria bacterium]|nr:hypothetical protein [Actinomycetota bacterium]